jgi:DNA-binding HxlR family transcriptional regulator
VLDELEENEYIERRVAEGSLVVVYYSLTPKGEELLSAFDEIYEWGEMWISESN